MNLFEILNQQAGEAYLDLALLAQSGLAGTVDYDKALRWAETAAEHNNPLGYLAISEIVKHVLHNDENQTLDNKREWQNYAVGVCDPKTVQDFALPAMAYNVGDVCEFMANYGRQNHFPDSEIRQSYILAENYYQIAVDMKDRGNSVIDQWKISASEGLERVKNDLAHFERPHIKPPALPLNDQKS
jgi:TPR repeat protein